MNGQDFLWPVEIQCVFRYENITSLRQDGTINHKAKPHRDLLITCIRNSSTLDVEGRQKLDRVKIINHSCVPHAYSGIYQCAVCNTDLCRRLTVRLNTVHISSITNKIYKTSPKLKLLSYWIRQIFIDVSEETRGTFVNLHQKTPCHILQNGRFSVIFARNPHFWIVCMSNATSYYV